MPFTNLSIKHFRCFENLQIELSPGVNFFYGANGSGKTSLLESIYIFSSGKSFKSTNLKSLINYNHNKFLLETYDNSRGYISTIKKSSNGPISIKLNNKKITTSNLVREFPCTAIHNNTFSFANASPDFRRKILDRSIFIAEEGFSKTWFSFYRSLKQRNNIIKKNRISDIYAWDIKVSEEGEILNNYRVSFFNKTLEEFNRTIETLRPLSVFNFFDSILIEFSKGWDNQKKLSEILNDNKEKDILRKTTTQGPHKADINFLINKLDARQILSRGEQKFFSILWCCSQHEVLKKHYNINATLLIDDIKSELDDKTFNLLVELLKASDNQVIFSCIENCFSSKIEHDFNNFKKFHVEQLINK